LLKLQNVTVGKFQLLIMLTCLNMKAIMQTTAGRKLVFFAVIRVQLPNRNVLHKMYTM